MAKISIWMGTLLATGLALSACKSGGDSSATPTSATAPENTEAESPAKETPPSEAEPSKAAEATRDHYQPFDDAKMSELTAALDETATGHPFALPDLTRDEKLTFWIQSYKDEWIGGWISKNYKKLHNFEKSKPDAEQDEKLKVFLDKPSDREQMYQFMRILSDKQLNVLGY